MRIVIWGINYAPELTGIAPYNTALCQDLRARGHDVAMVTTFSYYPAWRKKPEDEHRIFRTDLVDGVPVHRCWHYVPAKVSAIKRIIHEGTFVANSFLRLAWLAIIQGRRPDVLVVVSPPLALGAAAWMFALLAKATGRRVPFVFHVQDLQPDAALGLGMLKQGMLTRALYRLEALAYRAATRVSGISHGMLDAFARKGVPAEKRVYFPNPVVLPDLERDLPPPGLFRKEHGFSDKDFLAIYSGNLGVKQGLSILLDTAAILRATTTSPEATNPAARRIRIVICGDGADRERLAARVTSENLSDAVTLLPLQPRDRYEQMLRDADMCLITQQAGSGQSFFPSKLLTTLAFAKPVLTVADSASELARALDEGRFGIDVKPDQPQQLAQALTDLAKNSATLAEMGNNGRKYVTQFAAEKVFGDFESVLKQIDQEEGPNPDRLVNV
jgi:colanic acid biosynthesis glycosyl transferase WcaI